MTPSVDANHRLVNCDATQNTLQKADDMRLESVVAPALECGVAGFGLFEGARIICETINDYDPDALKYVRIIAYSGEEFLYEIEVPEGPSAALDDWTARVSDHCGFPRWGGSIAAAFEQATWQFEGALPDAHDQFVASDGG